MTEYKSRQDSIKAGLQEIHLLQTIAAAYAKLIEALEDEEDVEDGYDGGFTANAAMRYLQGQEAGIAALKRLGEVTPCDRR